MLNVGSISKSLKLVILDIDGVLNNSPFVLEAHKKVFGDKFRAVKEEDFDQLARESIDPKAISILNDLIAGSGAKVVISSNWRLHYTASEILVMLKNKGFIGEIIGTTSEITRGIPENRRAFEISDWLVAHEKLETIESLVILDDEEIGCGWDDHQVRTDKSNGLTKEDVDKALEILKLEW